ncbi:phosphate ABC transporter permease [Methylophaga sp. 42_25_T18]|nr:phosphate ABC transporter permease [Methylophaga sp. 42_25_T18]OUR87176.1 phosphate ABC transporter permease [Methylophaga sp. 42_8_T64]
MIEHSLKDSVLPALGSPLAKRRRAWREFKDRCAKYGVAVGGMAVIFAIVLIFFYLLSVVIPLFHGAQMDVEAAYEVEANSSSYLTLNEYNDVALSLNMQGQVRFFAAQDGHTLLEPQLPLPSDVDISSFSKGAPSTGVFAYGFVDGRALVFKQAYKISYPEDKRLITPRIDYPLDQDLLVVDADGAALQLLSVQSNEEQTTLAAVTADHRLVINSIVREQDFMDEDLFTIEQTSSSVALSALTQVTHVQMDIDQRELYLVDNTGMIAYYDISDVAAPRLVQHVKAVPAGVAITTVEFLTGGISILVGRSDGQIDQWFPVRDQDNNYTLHKVRSFHEQYAEIVAIAPEYSRKGFVALDADGLVGIYHTTAERTLLVEPLVVDDAVMALSPRANGLLSVTRSGQAKLLTIDNEHPEVSWHSLWEEVWYESRDKPEHIWQSSSASNDFEPKFSLTPLTFGTIKAAFYAMAVAVPLGIFGAIYTAYFMSASMRKVVKPTIEIMEALPTVILGFLAGLWLAPIVEGNLPGVFSILIMLPVMTVLTAYLWSRIPSRLRNQIPDGWEAAILVPVVIMVGVVSMMMSPTLELWLFDGNMPQWLNEVGIDFDQRNSLVVGLVMGFAVIPTIFSITEDAIFGVPKHLTIGSLALGATPWQTLTRVVLLTASPGIFSAVMIGLGRAVGETMIVLMATGNTPIMDFNIFEGFRALSANIAVEMPEAEVASSHYRVLFLAALVLFMVTFIFNTVAEVIRQRLRNKYSSL